ncbi:hypothetical protein R4Z10_10480 [Niallia sp. XMNu-256]|uniref:hypothetical protein n=1 Tax=Niallia sp. XMNu-256 TaxID=3082444 RepID=UPI0030D57989
MAKLYTDYINRTALSVPDHFIDVKSGEKVKVSREIYEQIDYHAENQTLIHLVLSALYEYLHPRKLNESDDILLELAQIKEMLIQGYQPKVQTSSQMRTQTKQPEIEGLDMKEVEDILEIFGG